ncbi:MAG: hypothetical protein V1706_15870 [Pseudomonadota bacterium]
MIANVIFNLLMKIYLLTIIIFSCILPFLVFAGEQKAGFDCGRAQTKIEKAICRDSYLSWLDLNMTKNYKKILSRGVANIKSDQKQWFKQRNECSKYQDDASLNWCLKNIYGERNKELGIIVKKTDYPEKGFGRYEILNWWPTGIKTHIIHMSPDDKELCESFEDFLNKIPTKQPYRCSIKSQSDFFVRAKWNRLDNANDKITINRIFKTLYESNVLPEYYKSIYEKGEFAVKSTILKNVEGYDNNSIIYELSINKICTETGDEWIERTYLDDNRYFIESPTGEIKTNNPPVASAELLIHQNNILFYGFSNHLYDENWKELDHEMSDVYLMKKTNWGYSKTCRYQYIK